VPRSRLPLRLGRDLPAHLDAAALAAILVAATDGLKDLSDILDPPSREPVPGVPGVTCGPAAPGRARFRPATAGTM